MTTQIQIAGREIGPGYPCFIIAEAGVNHNGDMELARRLVDAAVAIGADAVKFQTFKTELVMTREAPKAAYQRETTGAGESQFDMVKRLELPPAAFSQLMAYCHEREILFLSSPFDDDSADLLAELDVAAFKIPSGEIPNIPFLARVARNSKPMIVSTGMSDLAEVAAAVGTIREAGNEQFVLLHCVSNYPADPEDVNLKAMETMAAAFQVPVGYSDHTPGIEVPIAAVAMGACVIEKHLTLDHDLAGPDHRASLEPEEFEAMVRGIRTVESALGDGRKEPAASEADTAAVARKSLIAASSIPAGTVLTDEHITVKRPGTGLAPGMMHYLLGRVAKVDIPEDSLIALEDLV